MDRTYIPEQTLRGRGKNFLIGPTNLPHPSEMTGILREIHEGSSLVTPGYEDKRRDLDKGLVINSTLLFYPRYLQMAYGDWMLRAQPDLSTQEMLDNIEEITPLFEHIAEIGPNAEELLAGPLREDAIRQMLVHVLTLPLAQQLATEIAWEAMGSNIVELSPSLTKALLETKVSVNADDFHLPISPLYIAVPRNMLFVIDEDLKEEEARRGRKVSGPLSGQYVSIDGFLVYEIDYEDYPGDVLTFEKTALKSESHFSHELPGGAQLYNIQDYKNPDLLRYEDESNRALGGLRFAPPFIRSLRVLAYTNPLPGEPPEATQLMYFSLPLAFPGDLEKFIKEDGKIQDLAENYGANALDWVRVVFNTILYMNSKEADIKKVPNLSESEKRKIAKVKGKKAKKDLKNRLQKNYRLVKLGKNYEMKAKSKEGRTFTHRHIVKGHWKVQRRGPNLEDTKNIWIQPYYRGKFLPEDARPRIYKNPH